MTATNTRSRIEFGDFQTPDTLSCRVCDLLEAREVSARAIVEPTCGRGSFLRASAAAFPECERILGFEINPEYVKAAQRVNRASVYCEDFFTRNWRKTLEDLPEPVLIIGNPPWVTNSAIGALRGTNLPTKCNFQNFSGYDAISGKSNFDISESIMLHLLECLSGRSAVLAMLCKTTVARKVLQHSWNRGLQIRTAATYAIDTVEHFGAAVDACLLICGLEPGAGSQECDVYAGLGSARSKATFGLHHGKLVTDLKIMKTHGHLYGQSPLRWRSGIKHDCARVMELHPRGGGVYENGLSEHVNLEPAFLYPMFKSSDLAKANSKPSRYMLITQRTVGEDTTRIRHEAPRTWRYLEEHAAYLDARSSVIYRNRPRFSVFGVGAYAFAPWKVAISGFYKQLNFRCIGPIDSRPVMFDDTCYFLHCQSEDDARTLLAMLESDVAKAFLGSLIFWDAKRPVTADLLGRLDLGALADELGVLMPNGYGGQYELPLWQ